MFPKTIVCTLQAVPPVVRQAMEVSVVHCPAAVPRVEYGPDGSLQLLVRVLRESLTGFLEDEALEVGGYRLPL